MNEREKPFPVSIILTAIFMVGFGVVGHLNSYGDLLSGFFIGYGVTAALWSTMVWASPMNERRK